MFERNRRSDAADDDTGMDDELEKDRFATAASAEAPPSNKPSSGTRVREAAIIGPSIHIDGDLRGEEDLLVEGTVNGTVQMREHTLTIGSHGQVKATVYANSVYVDGTLEGDLYGSERVAIRKTGSVTGTITSPRISLDDGGYFKGTMEMDQESVDKAFGKKPGESAGSSAGAASAKAGPAGSGSGAGAASGSGAASSAASDSTGKSDSSASGSTASSGAAKGSSS